MRDKERGNYERLIRLSIIESLVTAKVGPEEEARIVAVVHDFIVRAATLQVRRIGANLSDIDDVVQETLTTMLQLFRSGRLRRMSNVLGLLTAIARRRAIDMRRSSRRTRQLPDAAWVLLENQLESDAATDSNDPDDPCKALADVPGLSPLNLRIIELRSEGLTWAQVSFCLRKDGWNYKPSALRVRWHRLQPYFGRRGDDFRDLLGTD